MGSIYKRGPVWWVKWSVSGKPYFESSRSKKKRDAVKLLKLREGQAAKGEFHGLLVERILFDELAADFVRDYLITGKKSIGRAKISVRRLKEYFGGMKASAITSDMIRAYIARRKKGEKKKGKKDGAKRKGVKNGTINRELSALKRIFSLASRSTPPKVTQVPYIPRLEESNARQGFFSHEEYQALKEALPAYLKPVVTAAYHTGMRKGEILGLKWGQVDLVEGKITLRAADTKNKKARVVFMGGEFLETVRFQKIGRDARFPECPWVFFNEQGHYIGAFRKTWRNACKKAWKDSEGKVPLWDAKKKKPTRIFHDFRRSAVRNMVRAGVPERVAMTISGHKTRDVFERYNITNEDDLKRASKKIVEYHDRERAETEQEGYKRVTVGDQEAPDATEDERLIH